MKKQYIVPSILGHKIITPKILCGSTSLTTNNDDDFDGYDGKGIKGDSNTLGAKSYNHGSLFDDEPVEKNDFAYGL